MSAKKQIDVKPIVSCRNQRKLRELAVAQGMPKFMLRLAAAQHIAIASPETMVRHRHD